MKVKKDQEMRFNRGNLARARAALAGGNLSAAVKFLGVHARNRQKAAKEK